MAVFRVTLMRSVRHIWLDDQFNALLIRSVETINYAYILCFVQWNN